MLTVKRIATLLVAGLVVTGASADGAVEAKSVTEGNKAGDNNVTMVGQVEKKPIHKSVGIYKLSDWEGDITTIIDEINAISPKVAKLIEDKDLLISKPNGNPLQNVATTLEKTYEAVEKAIEDAGEQDPVAMKKLRNFQSKVYERLERLENYVHGPKHQEFLLKLTGEGKGVFDVELNNGKKVEVRYAVGADRSVTPDVVDYPVVAIMPIAANSDDETSRYAYSHGIALRGENTVIIQWDNIPHDMHGAKWRAQKVHNISEKAWKFITCKTGYCTPMSTNKHNKSVDSMSVFINPGCILTRVSLI